MPETVPTAELPEDKFEVPYEQVQAELIDDFHSDAEPPGDLEERTDGQESEPVAAVAGKPPVAAEPAPPAAPTAQAPAPGQTFFTFQGKKYATKDDLIATLAGDEQLLVAALTRAEQTPHYQRLLEEERQKRQEFLEQVAQSRLQAPPPAQHAPDPAQTMEQLRRNFKPAVEQAVAAGLIESEVAELYPAAVTQIFAQQTVIDGLRQTVADLYRDVHGSKKEKAAENFERETTAIHRSIDNAIATASEKGGLFEALKDPAAKERFKDELWAMNIEVDKINQRFVEKMYLASQDELILAERQAAADRETALEAQRRGRRQGAGGGSPRPSSTSAPAISPFEDITREDD